MSTSYRVAFRLKGAPVVMNFVGRDRLLEEMQRHTIESYHPKRQKIVVLHGLGGIGKTQIAIEYAVRNQESYTAVFWLNGKTADSLRISLASVAEHIPLPAVLDENGQVRKGEQGIEAAVSAVIKWLEAPGNSKWLLIIDNVDKQNSGANEASGSDDHYDIRDYLPSGFQGTTILTTRLSRLGQLGTSISVGEVEMIDGIQMLRNIAGQRISDTGKQQSSLAPDVLTKLSKKHSQSSSYFRVFLLQSAQQARTSKRLVYR